MILVQNQRNHMKSKKDAWWVTWAVVRIREPVTNPQSPSGLIQRFSRGKVLAERWQDLGSGAKTCDFSGQRKAKIWFFSGQRRTQALGFSEQS